MADNPNTTPHATAKQIARLIDASENLAAYFSMDACRVIAEWPGDDNLVPYLNNLPVKIVREFDEAIADITIGGFSDDEAEIRAKYERAMEETRRARLTHEPHP